MALVTASRPPGTGCASTPSGICASPLAPKDPPAFDVPVTAAQTDSTAPVGVRSEAIRVLLADDNLLVREGVRALLGAQRGLEVVGVAEDYDGVIAGADEYQPDVVVTDIRMPPSFSDEGIAASMLVRARHPGTGIVVLSQYDDPEYAVALLEKGPPASRTCSRNGCRRKTLERLGGVGVNRPPQQRVFPHEGS